jgi:hypothetical protein
MKRAWILVVLLLGGFLAVGCKSGPSDDQCKQLLDHLVDLEFKKAGAAASSDTQKADIAKQKTKVAEGKSAEFVEQCTKKTSRARVECALAANDIDGDNGVSKCDEAK